MADSNSNETPAPASEVTPSQMFAALHGAATKAKADREAAQKRLAGAIGGLRSLEKSGLLSAEDSATLAADFPMQERKKKANGTETPAEGTGGTEGTEQEQETETEKTEQETEQKEQKPAGGRRRN